MEGLTEGRIVHYVLSSWDSAPGSPNNTTHAGEHRPGIVVKVWNPAAEKPLVQLQVFTDSGPNADSNDGLPQVMWKTSVEYDPEGKAGTWHWIEKA